MKPNIKAKSYYIAFETFGFPGSVSGKNIRSVKVTIEHEIIPESAMDVELPINLWDNPLYTQLERYVVGNMDKKRAMN